MNYKNLFTKCCFLLFVFFAAVSANAQVSSIGISAGWKFHEQDEASWYPAKIPGEVHTDLLANKLIPDPFYRDNEKKLQWIENENWDYKFEGIRRIDEP